MDLSNSDISQEVRICLLNQVLPKYKQVKSVGTNDNSHRNMVKIVNVASESNSSGRRGSIPKDCKFGTFEHNVSVNEEISTESVTLKSRKKAFDFLQELAFNVRKDINLVNCDDRPHDYLELIHESQVRDGIIIEQSRKIKVKPEVKKLVKPALEKEVAKPKLKLQKISSQQPQRLPTNQPLVSSEVISGLDSILQGYKPVTNVNKSTKKAKRVIRKRRCSDKDKTLSTQGSSAKSMKQIGIPTNDLISIIKQLSLI